MKIDRKRSCARNTAQIIAAQSEDLQISKRELSTKFQCATCNKTFSSRGNLKAHNRIHSGEKPFRCDECNKSFSFPGNLTVHKRIHANIKPYKCEDCGKTFSAKGNLLAHARTHTGIKPFKCKECGKRFSHKGNLNAHMRLHSGLKPFICSYCKKGFAHKGNLNVHLKVHGKPVTYSCEICPKVFSKLRLLKKHQYRHSHAFKANYALQEMLAAKNISKKAETAGSNAHKILSHNDNIEKEESKKIQDLQQDHMRLHWKPKSFTCSECNKGFVFKRSLTIHMKVHGRPTTYSCEICPKVFSEKRLLKKHLEQHSNPAKANDALRELLAGENISMEPGILEMSNNSESAKLNDSNINNLISLTDTVVVEGRKNVSDLQQNQDGKDKLFECVVCSHKIFDEQKLEIHLRSHLPNSKVYSK
ncbi:hypothetical protein CHS0354_009446 [Potamilus streckersoni]|uniref:C2H2-type domain-containing protein n=1 Tax=Potamilus streckersoni TaxID=2493646 RepID=A0AAE0TJQ0_9BIVA|nr:hypothetical protein CHS0354_009446 [Potamilus streckersoni]